MTGQFHLFGPARRGHHAKVTDGHLQLRTFLYHLFQFGHLCGAVGHVDGQQYLLLLHQVEHAHHLVAVQPYAAFLQQQALGGNLDAAESLLYQLLGLLVESRLAELAQTAHEEAVGIAGSHVGQVFILYAVDKLLCDDCCRHLGIVHVRQEDFGRVATVNHKRRKHLPHLAHEERTAVLQRTDGQVVHHRVLTQPQVGMRVDNRIFHGSRF